MSKNLVVSDISIYLPEQKLTNEDINRRFPEWEIEKISLKTGITCRHIAQDNEFALDMAVKCVNNLFENNQVVKKDQVDFLIYITQSPDYVLPTNACILQDLTHLPKTAGAFDVNLGCSAYVYGLSLAHGLMQSGQAKNILLVTSETYSKYIHPQDKGNITIFGDAATASLLTNFGITSSLINFKFLDSNFYTDGSNYDKLIVKNSGLRHKRVRDSSQQEASDKTSDADDYLYMDGKAVFEFTNIVVPQVIGDLLTRNNLDISNIDLFLFHQANAFMISSLKRRMKINDSQYFFDINDIGNTVSATIPIALKRVVESRDLQKGSKILISGFGVGLSIANILFEIE